MNLIVPANGEAEHGLSRAEGRVPAIIAGSSPQAFKRYLLFYAASIRNVNTRQAYQIAAAKFFAWCERHDITRLEQIRTLHVAAYIELLTHEQAAPTVKQNLAALRMLFEALREPVENPAANVRGPKHVVRMGRTPVLSGPQAKMLIESIPTETLSGRRDRALIALMIYSFARVSAVIGMDVKDYYLYGNRRWIRLVEKGSKCHTVPVHHKAEELIDAYLASARIVDGALFRTVDRQGRITAERMSRQTAWEMVKRRAREADLPEGTTNHTFRATGITCYLSNGGTIENAKNIAAHASIKTTQSYDRREETVTLDEINRIYL
jgi:integrase/recombinase XerD